MYVKKFDILKTYTTKDYLLGRGWESDLVRTTEWWWVEKGSHNDYLTYVVENGIPYTILFVLLILSLLFLSRKVSLIFASMVIGYLLTSALSNGMAVRPLASYFFFIVLAYIYCNNKKFIQKNNDLVKEKT
jgi:O-antigen ligase